MPIIHQNSMVIPHFVSEFIVLEFLKVIFKLKSEHIGFDDIQVDIYAINFLQLSGQVKGFFIILSQFLIPVFERFQPGFGDDPCLPHIATQKLP